MHAHPHGKSDKHLEAKSLPFSSNQVGKKEAPQAASLFLSGSLMNWGLAFPCVAFIA
jgi:hypothetical protein